MPVLTKTIAGLAIGATAALAFALPSKAMPISRAPVAGASMNDIGGSMIRVRGGARYDKLRQRDAEARRNTFRDARRDDVGGPAYPRAGRDGFTFDDNT